MHRQESASHFFAGDNTGPGDAVVEVGFGVIGNRGDDLGRPFFPARGDAPLRNARVHKGADGAGVDQAVE